MSKNLRSRLSTHAGPALGALAIGAIALLLVWSMQKAAQVESYDPAKHDRVRVVTVDQARLRECLDKYPGEQRAAVGYQRCTDGYTYDVSQDYFIPKAQPARP